MHVFDVDGTLASTSQLVVKAYGLAGVVVRNPEELQTHWKEWLLPKVSSVSEAERIRSLKATKYMHLLEKEPPKLLPCGELAKRLLDEGERVRVITAAHPASTRRLLKVIGLSACTIVGTEVAPADRVEILRHLGRTGHYYDDNLSTINLIQGSVHGWHAHLSWTIRADS